MKIPVTSADGIRSRCRIKSLKSFLWIFHCTEDEKIDGHIIIHKVDKWQVC